MNFGPFGENPIFTARSVTQTSPDMFRLCNHNHSRPVYGALSIILFLSFFARPALAQWTLSGSNLTSPPSQLVGVGTTAPTQRLDVNGNVQVPSTGLIGFGLGDNFTYMGQTMGHYSLGWFPDSSFSGGNSSWYAAYGNIKLFTEGTLRIMVGANGYNGFNTNSPGHVIHAVGLNATTPTSYIWGSTYGEAIGVQNATSTAYAFAVLGNLASTGSALSGGLNIIFMSMVRAMLE